MSYITYSDIDNRVRDLEDYVPAGKDAETWVQAQIDAAERRVNGRLAAFGAPFAEPYPSLVVEATALYAIYEVLRQEGLREQPEGNVAILSYRDEAEKILQMIVDEEVALDGSVDSDSEDGGAISSTTDVARTFTRTLKDSSGNVISEGSLEGI